MVDRIYGVYMSKVSILYIVYIFQRIERMEQY